MHLDGWSVLLQIVNFAVLAWLLRRFLWKPLTAAMAERQKQVDDLEAKSKTNLAAAEQSKADYAAKVAGAEAERTKLLAAAQVEITALRAKSVEAARAKAAAEQDAAHKALDEERKAAATALSGDAVGLAVDIAGRMIADLGAGAVAAVFVDRLCTRLEAETPDAIAALREDMGSALEVASAPLLDDAGKANLGDRLAKVFGARPTLQFVEDASLVAGVELRFQHSRVDASLRQTLDAARTALVAP